jgi:hypothetical protein
MKKSAIKSFYFPSISSGLRQDLERSLRNLLDYLVFYKMDKTNTVEFKIEEYLDYLDLRSTDSISTYKISKYKKIFKELTKREDLIKKIPQDCAFPKYMISPYVVSAYMDKRVNELKQKWDVIDKVQSN